MLVTGIITTYLRMRRLPDEAQVAFSLRNSRLLSLKGPALPISLLLWPERFDCFKELCGRGHVGRGEDNRVSARAVDARDV